MDLSRDSPMTEPERTSGLLKAGGTGLSLMSITTQDYESELWPRLSGAITQLLVSKPGEYLPLSYEQMYSCVYKCVCRQFSERLYSDLFQQITQHLELISLQLQACEGTSSYVPAFSAALERYLQALQGIVPVFNYMNRFYIEPRLRTDLLTELHKLFVSYVCDRHMDVLLPLLDEAHLRPFFIAPAVMATLVKNLYILRPEYAQVRVQLFARYIPRVLPPCTLAHLAHYIQEAQQLRRDLLRHPDFISGDQGRKRLCGDDLMVCEYVTVDSTSEESSL